MVAMFGGYLWHRSEREAWGMIPAFLLNLALSVPFYLLCPVCGPAYAFPGFPAPPAGPVLPHPILLDAPANGVPSIHFSTAMLILWYGRKLPFGGSIGVVYAVLTAISTLASGEHYLFDLLVAVPYAAMVLALGECVARLWSGFRPRCAGVIMIRT
jgi:membrane-associated phospholipid phosphatase